MKEKKQFNINYHLLLALILVIIVVIVVFRLNKWNKRNVVIDTDVAEDAYEMECMDYYVYADAEALANHVDNGQEDILFIGNSILTNNGADKSVIAACKEKMDANIYELIADNSKVTSNVPEEYTATDVFDTFSLYKVVKAVALKDTQAQTDALYKYEDSIFSSHPKERANEYQKTMLELDLNDIDTVIIMYSLLDYYNAVPTLLEDELATNSYHGALYSSIRVLQDLYPHLNIIVASPVPGYVKNQDGTLALASSTVYDPNIGNASAYINMQYFVATKCCVSYLDNYYYTINENNITEYLDGFYLSDKGIDLVSDHLIKFLNEKP